MRLKNLSPVNLISQLRIDQETFSGSQGISRYGGASEGTFGELHTGPGEFGITQRELSEVFLKKSKN